MLYLTSKTNGAVNSVKKFTVNGTSGTLSTFATQTAWKLAKDGAGNVYVSDNPSKKVYKYNSGGALVTSFDARPAGGTGDIGGIAVNSAGTRLYVSQMNGSNGLPNHVNRFDSTNGATYTHNANESIGGNYNDPQPCGTKLSSDQSQDPAGTPVPGWVGYFAYSWDVGLDEQGNVYALSTTCHEVLKFGPSGRTFITGMKVNTEDSNFADNGRPHGLAVAGNGEVYVGEASAKMDLPGIVAPTATVTGGPANGSTDADTTPTFGFASNQAGSSFECKLDNAAAFTACASPYTTPTLTAGQQHTFSVRAKNANGTGAADSRTWTVGTTPGTCGTKQATITGTAGNDTLAGTNGADVIVGLGGNDTVRGLGGNDTICGDDGNDTIVGGGNDDALYGGLGSDTVSYEDARAGVAVHLSYPQASPPTSRTPTTPPPPTG